MKTDRLRAHQVEPAIRLLDIMSAGKNAVDLSDTGTGKTYTASCVAHELDLPTLVVAPKICRTQWENAAAHFGDKFSVVGYEMLRTGRSGFGSWDHTPPAAFKREEFFKCQSCQLPVDFDAYRGCYCHPLGIHCIETKKKPWKYGRFNFHPGVRLLIFDEVHRCGAMDDSLDSRMLIAARRQGILTLCLSATAASSPLHMRALGYVLGLHNLENFYGWTRRFGCGKIPGIPGWQWLAGEDKQEAAMLALRKAILPGFGVRVSTRDIPDFPKRTITAELFDLDAGQGIDALYWEMQSALEKLFSRAENDISSDHPLTQLLRARQKIELLKVPAAVEAARDEIAKGNSVGIFVNFKQTIEELRARLNCRCVIDGSVTSSDRMKHVADFNSDRVRLMLLNNEVGGAGLDLPDRNGKYPRVGLVMPPQSARTFKQLAGRFHREGSLTPCFYKVMLAANSIEEKIHRRLNLRLQNIDLLNDGADFMEDLTLA